MRRLLVVVAGATLAETVFFSVLAPLLPHYARILGLSKFEAGILVGSYAAGACLGAVPAGLLASRLDAKVTMLVGVGSMAALSSVFGFVDSLWLLVLVRVALGVGAALAWTGALTWLVNEAPRARRGELMGLATAGAAVGALLGPAIGAGATVAGTRATFGALGASGLLLVLWTSRVPAPRPGDRQPLAAVLPAIKRPGLAGGLWLLALASLAFGVIGLLAPLRLSRLGLSGAEIGLVFVLAAVLQAVVSAGIGRWADTSGRGTPLRVSLAVLAAMSLLIPFAASAWSVAIVVVVALTACMAFFAPALALLADDADGAGLEQALIFALVNAAWAPGNLIGSVASGAVAGAVGDLTPYAVVTLLCSLSLVATTRYPTLLRSDLNREPAEGVVAG